ncbi:hypothetical protein ACFSQ3_13065 [Sphingobacterium corticis]|uniref:Helix-turn-helix domain-containing protein n=1 Tax=Sphingobacterium corticis TaxID=1812823 RepID=A0ABW5NLB1_9SPHI
MRPVRDFSEAQRLRDMGYTIAKVSRELRMCRKMIAKNTIKTVEPDRSLKRKISTASKRLYTRAQNLRDSGMKIEQIAKSLGVSYSTIQARTTKPNKNRKVDKAYSEPKKTGTGELKNNAIDKVITRRIIDPTNQRHIYIPFLRATVSVKKTDKRTDEEILRFWADKKAKEDKTFKSPYLAKPVKGKGGSDE